MRRKKDLAGPAGQEKNNIKKRQKKTAAKVLSYIRHYFFLAVLSLLFAAVNVVTALYLPMLTGDAVDTMLKKGAVDFILLKELLFFIAFR